MHNWTCAVQTRVVQGSTVFRQKGMVEEEEHIGQLWTVRTVSPALKSFFPSEGTQKDKAPKGYFLAKLS